MLDKEKIELSQLKTLVIIFTIGSSVLVAPSILAADAKQDAWLSAILGVSISSLLILLYCSLAMQFPEKTLAGVNEVIFGKWMGKVVSLSYFSYFFVVSALLLREIGDFLTTHIMVATPIHAILILFMTIVIFGTRLGIETLSRAGQIFFPLIFLLLGTVILFLFPQMTMENVLPVLEKGIKPVLKATFHFLGLPFLEFVVFLMFTPKINNFKKVRKPFLVGMFIGGFSIVTITFVAIAVLGASSIERHIYPSYAIARKISLGNFIQRIEAMVAGIWFISIFFKLTVFFYSSTLMLTEILQLREYRFLTLPLGMITILLSIVGSRDITYFNWMISVAWTPYSMTFGLFLPLLTLCIAIVKKKIAGSP